MYLKIACDSCEYLIRIKLLILSTIFYNICIHIHINPYIHTYIHTGTHTYIYIIKMIIIIFRVGLKA